MLVLPNLYLEGPFQWFSSTNLGIITSADAITDIIIAGILGLFCLTIFQCLYYHVCLSIDFLFDNMARMVHLGSSYHQHWLCFCRYLVIPDGFFHLFVTWSVG